MKAEYLVLAAIGYLMCKHAVADFMLQNEYQVSNKMKFGHPGGMLHALIHAVLTLPVFLILPARYEVVATVFVAELVFHYSVDYIKERIMLRYGWKPDNARFWWALGVDQLVHNMTYLSIVAYLVTQSTALPH